MPRKKTQKAALPPLAMLVCKPRQPPYLKDLRLLAKQANIPNYSSMRKEELCEALGMIEKAGPYVKKTIQKQSPKAKEVSEITSWIDKYVKKNKLTASTVKESFRPPAGAQDYYYLWFPEGKGARRKYVVPEGTLVNVKIGSKVIQKPLEFGKQEFGSAYLGNSPKNQVFGFDVRTTSYTPVFGEGFDAWVKPSAPFSVISKRKGWKEMLKDMKETQETFKTQYRPGHVQHNAKLRRAGNEYSWP